MSSHKPHILVVDDMPQNLQLLTRLLIAHDYDVSTATNGAAGLAAVRTMPPDLILLDVMMPGLSGYDVCEQLKTDALTHDIPVIFISALGEVLDKMRAFSAGAVDYITKPIQPEEVWARIETHLTLRTLRQQLETQNAQLRQEIAERRRAEEALAQRAAELEARNQELDAFAHSVAHDLKGPLANMVIYGQMLNDDVPVLTPEQIRHAHDVIVRNGRRMGRIIDSLLLLSQIRHTEAAYNQVDMSNIVNEALQRLDEVINRSNARIHHPDAWPIVWTCPGWTEEVWTNYMSNALKYGGSPLEIYLGWDKQPTNTDGSDSTPHTYRFWVRDNGVGLTPEEQACLFTPFTRLNQASIKGHGLGLSIVRRIIEKMGGEVGVESAVGGGSTFYFTLPQRDPAL